jgi:hypothetical protein
MKHIYDHIKEHYNEFTVKLKIVPWYGNICAIIIGMFLSTIVVNFCMYYYKHNDSNKYKIKGNISYEDGETICDCIEVKNHDKKGRRIRKKACIFSLILFAILTYLMIRYSGSIIVTYGFLTAAINNFWFIIRMYLDEVPIYNNIDSITFAISGLIVISFIAYRIEKNIQ